MDFSQCKTFIVNLEHLSQTPAAKRKWLYLLGGRHLRKSCLNTASHFFTFPGLGQGPATVSAGQKLGGERLN